MINKRGVIKAFNFINLAEKPQKPRSKSVIEIRGPYYYPVTPNYVKNLLETYSEHIDGFKFAGGSPRLISKDLVKKFIKLCHDHNVYVSTGGFIERVIVQGSKAVDEYLEECKSLEFDVIEVSSGLAKIPLHDQVEIVKQVKKLGMKAKPEISLILGAGAGTEIVDYKENIKLNPVSTLIKKADAFLKAGAYMLMLESEGITEGLPPKKWRTDVIKKLSDRFGTQKWMFEAAEPPVFKWYLKNFGQNVNLFIDHSQIVEYTAWALKLWGDQDIWKNKVFKYKS